VFPDEKLVAGVTSGPTIFTVASDVRFFPGRPPILARGSKVLANIVESKQAGRFRGKAQARIALTSILTADYCEYPIDAAVVEAGPYKIDENVVMGKGHAKRDVFALLFPPTTLYQLLRLPARGPQLIVDNETPLVIKLLQPLSIGQPQAALGAGAVVEDLKARISALERELSGPGTEDQPVLRSRDVNAARIGEPCPAAGFRAAMRPIMGRSVVTRPVRNLTRYHVSLYVDRRRVLVLPPCYGPSLVPMPTSNFSLKAMAGRPTSTGQANIEVRVVPNREETGWDIVSVNDLRDAIE
jgi:hypothetical protein